MKKAKVLKTQRLTLRPFKKKDALAIYKGWGNDPEVSKFMTWNTNESVEDVKKFVYSVLNNPEGRKFNWIVILKKTKKPIGSLGISQIDYKKMSCDIGYCYNKEYWNKGYATEALKRIIKYLFEEKSFQTITAYHHVLNTASGSVMKKCGMKYQKTENVYIKIKDTNFLSHFYKITNKD
ncbi:MAG: GNAT family N-acetyltransferase [Bacillota bacterium]